MTTPLPVWVNIGGFYWYPISLPGPTPFRIPRLPELPHIPDPPCFKLFHIFSIDCPPDKGKPTTTYTSGPASPSCSSSCGTYRTSSSDSLSQTLSCTTTTSVECTSMNICNTYIGCECQTKTVTDYWVSCSAESCITTTNKRTTTTTIERTTTTAKSTTTSTMSSSAEPSPTRIAAFMVFQEDVSGGGLFEWWVIDEYTNSVTDVCDVHPDITVSSDSAPSFDFIYPDTTIGPFTSHGIKGCVYDGTTKGKTVGTMTCPGVDSIVCEKDPQYNEDFDCLGTVLTASVRLIF